MRKSIIISPSAANDIKECVRQAMIFTGFETSGIRLQDAIIDKIESIGFMPSAIGRLREDGSREAFVRGYRIVYEEYKESVFIIAVIHSSRLYPRP